MIGSPEGARKRRGHGDIGETLLEILATITIMGIALVAVVAGFGTALRSSDSGRADANATVALQTAAETVKTGSLTGVSGLVGLDTCSELTTLAATYVSALTALLTSPTGWTVSVASSPAPACLTANGVQQLLPKVTVKAVSSDGKTTQTIDVVRRSFL